MTIITGSQFRANQGMYIDMAHQGENVYIKTRRGNVVLTPVADDIEDEEKSFQEYVGSKSFQSVAEKARQEFQDGKTRSFGSGSEAQQWMDSL